MTSLFQSVKDRTSNSDTTKMQRYKKAAVYFLYPLDCLLPLAFSILRPFPLVKGLVWECGVPAAPKGLTASRAFLGPWRSRVFLPVGALKASWSKVIISPPAFKILSRAFSVTLRAQMVIFGISKILMSLVMVPTTTAILSAFPAFFMLRTRRAMERGGRLILLMNSLLRMILLNLASDLLARNLESFTKSLK